MSWSLTIPKQDDLDAFETALHDVKESPKADGRTKIGKAQSEHVLAAKNALLELAATSGALAGYASGHVNADLSGTISAGVTVYGAS